MKLSVNCHQLSFSSAKTENLSQILRVIQDSDGYLDVFPEYAMGVPEQGLDRTYVLENAEPLSGEFATKILKKTLEKQSAAVFTMFLKEPHAVYNAAILAEAGKIKAVYKKIHLFDAFGHKESALFSSGRELAIAELRGFTVGLAVCFDLRFPELFRAMAYRGVDLVIVPSAWYKGEHKLVQWRVLVLARAHENTAYVVAVNQTDPFFTGHSMVASPLAYALREVDEEQSSFAVEVDRKGIQEARKSVPTIRLSKPKLYRGFYPRI